MKIKNLDTSVRRLLVTQLRAAGVSEEEAGTRADAKLAEAVALFTASLGDNKRDPDFEAADVVLQAWALTNV
jgi:hypothetical protein